MAKRKKDQSVEEAAEEAREAEWAEGYKQSADEYIAMSIGKQPEPEPESESG